MKITCEKMEGVECERVRLMNEIKANGFEIQSVSDLFSGQWDYREIIPLLLDWVPKLEDPVLKEMVVRALAVKWARPLAGPILISEFLRPSNSDDNLKWAIGNALEVVADKSLVDQIVAICLDQTHGTTRQMLVLCLGRMKTVASTECLIRLLDDPTVQLHAIGALGAQRAEEAVPKLNVLANDPRAWIRKKAKGALNRILRDKRQS